MGTGAAHVTKIQEKTVNRIVGLAKGKYQGFNDRHLMEKLKEQEQIELCREKIRRILRSQGLLPRVRDGQTSIAAAATQGPPRRLSARKATRSIC